MNNLVGNMARILTVGAAQLGPIARTETRASAVARMLDLMREAKGRNCDLVVFPELALTTFFPRWYLPSQAEVDEFFESSMPNADTRVLYEQASKLGIAFYLGYAELASNAQDNAKGNAHFNTSILVNTDASLIGKYRKVHLPGHREHEAWRPFQHLEKRYFDPGDLGFPVWRALGGVLGMCICNDRRWPETFRVMGLRGVELVALGYNTPVHYPLAPEHDHLQDFHNHLVLQAGAYQNGTWVVAVAKAGKEEGCDLIGGSCIVAPTGEIVARANTLEDELVVAECDLDRCAEIKRNIFNFSEHRQPQHYSPIAANGVPSND